MNAVPGRSCALCGERYDASVLFCPTDGTPLSSSRNVSLTGDAGDPYLELELPGNITVRALVGVGSMGRVYKAFQTGVDRDVAVKILHRELSANPELVQRFHREARISSRLVHPNVVQVLMAGALPKTDRTGGELYLAMEYLDGISLASALAAASGHTAEALPLARTLHLLMQLCDAVGEAHAQGIVHRDLKPENIMLVRRGEDIDFVKVLDFGIARLDCFEAASTQAGLIFGTAKYISPEGAEGKRVGPQADVYAIATIAYQCLAGRTPFDSEAPMQLLMQQIQADPPELTTIPRAAYVPQAIARVIMRNLAKRPEERASDARALRRDLLTAARSSGITLDHGTGHTSLRLESKERTKQGGLSEEVEAALATIHASRGAPVDDGPTHHGTIETPIPAAPISGASSAQRTLLASEDPGDTIPGAEASQGGYLASQPPGPTMPGLPLDESPSSPRPNTPRSSSPHSYTRHSLEGLPFEAPREPSRFRYFVFALLLLVPLVVVTALLVKRSSTANAGADETYSAAEDAARSRAWLTPPGHSLRDLTDEGLRAFPGDERFTRLRRDAAERMVADALARKYEGDVSGALGLLQVALEWNPDLTAARRLTSELEQLAEAPLILPGSAVSAEETTSKPVVRAAGPRGGKPAASATPSAVPTASPSSKASPSAGPFLPREPPPISEEGPPPSSTGRPWL